MTKKFTAEEFNKQPAPVYRAADKDGSVEITHSHYPESVFVMELKDAECMLVGSRGTGKHHAAVDVLKGEYKQDE